MNRSSRALPIVVMAATLVACGGKRIPDLEPPQLSIVELRLEGNAAAGQLRLDNPVAAPMPADRLVFEMRLEGRSFGPFERQLGLTVPPLGSETVRIEFDVPEAVVDTLSGSAGRLEYRLEGRLQLDNGRALRFDDRGRLYPTPGRPGSWR